jgi:methanobactin biosynthesis MbnP-like protein
MKINKTIIGKIAIALATTGLMTFASCKKKDSTTTNPTPPVTYGVISFHLHTNISSNEDSLDANGIGVPIQDSIFTTVPSSKGYVNIKLDTAQLYISNVVFHNANGSNAAVSGQYILKYIGAEGPYIVGSVPTGNYTSVSFNVGLDAMANGMSPTSNMTNANQQFPGSSTTSGISFNVFNPPATFTNSVGDAGIIAPMWSGAWSSSNGYYFVNVSGYADTSALQIGQYQHFSYQLSTTTVAINLPAQTVVNAGQTSVPVTTGNTLSNPAEMHLICDYGQLMKGVTSFKPPYNTTANANTATAIRNGIANMFHYEID